MKLSNNVLELDIKVQDKYREKLSKLGKEDLSSTCVILGDSDIDYGLAPNIEKSRILSAPYNINGIKHKLIYNGVGANLSGIIKCFVRKVDSDGNILSRYEYPNNMDFIIGNKPPNVDKGMDEEILIFDNTKMGYILYFSTILDYYFDDKNNKQRLKEFYSFNFKWGSESVVPLNWDVVYDYDNGSILIAKDELEISNNEAELTIKGNFSNKEKIVKFKF